MSHNINYYQSITQLGITGRQATWKEFDNIGLPKDLKGKTVLDIGCNMGAFLVEAKKRGAGACLGTEINMDWRLLGNGVAKELGYKDMEVVASLEDISKGMKFDVVLLLSVTHVVEGMSGQEILDKAYERTKGLLILEVNDRLQTQKLNLPKEAKLYGKNKDGRSVYHIIKSIK